MKTKELINLLLECDMDAEISMDMPNPIADDEQMEITKVKKWDHGFGKFTVIEVGAA